MNKRFVLVVNALALMILALSVLYVSWDVRNGAEHFICRTFDNVYVLVEGNCSNGECTATEWDENGVTRIAASYSAESMYRNGASDTLHAYCIPVSTRDAEQLKSPAAITDAHGEAYTGDKTGIEATAEDVNDIAYIRDITEKDGVRSITIDPVTHEDCRQEDSVISPYVCDQVRASSLYRSDELTTHALAHDAGPYFISYLSGSMGWRTMDVATMQGVLKGTVSYDELFPEYYDPLLNTALFHIVQDENGVVTNVVQVYLP